MGGMADEFSSIRRQHTPAVITGKPPALEGSRGRSIAVGYGGYICLKELEHKHGWKPHNKTAAIQGFGNAGQANARLLDDDGYRVMAVSDSQGAIFRQEGLDIPAVIRRKNEEKALKAVYGDGSVCEANDAEQLGGDKLLELDVDILIPAAMENVVSAKNVNRVQAKTILELANGPLTSEADAAMAEKGVVVIPDFLANAGGVTVSYYEWVQNLSGDSWEEAEVTARLEKRMRKQFRTVQNLAGEHSTTLRTAAYALALQFIGAVVDALGTSRYFAPRT
jgi:glutamate dehydrogenase (NADP+)